MTIKNLQTTFGLLSALVLALGFAPRAGHAAIGVCDAIPASNVEVEATEGTLGPIGYPTLKDAFDAVNAGTHQGVINVEVCASTNELTTPATLNSTAAGSASYTALSVRPLADALTISGLPATGLGVIQLNGADSVTIDGDNPNSAGTNRDLTVVNAAGTSVILNSAIRIATSAVVTSANNNTIRNLILNGNVTGGNLAGVIGGTTSSNSSFGIYAGGNGGATAISAPVALTSVTSNSAPSGTTINNLVISNNAVNQAARGIVFIGANSAVTNALTISDNLLGAAGVNSGAPPYTSPATTIYTKGIYVAGASNLTVSGNTLRNLTSYISTTIAAIELATAMGTPIAISNNIILTVANNGIANGARGIQISSASGVYTVSGNTVSNVQVLAGTSGTSGIELSGTPTSGVVERNIISTIYNRSTGTFGAFGLNLATGTSITVRNNFISDVLMDMTGGGSFSTSFGVHGLRVNGGSNHRIHNNTVNLTGTLLGTANSSLLTSACTISFNTLLGIEMRNNICANTISGGTTGIAHVALFLPSGATSAMNLTQNNNDYFGGGDTATQGIAQVGVTPSIATLYLAANFDPASTAATTNLRNYSDTLRAATGNDNASIVSNPNLVSATDLHITVGSPAQNTGATIATVLNDIDGQLRPGGSGYDIGADEVDGVTPPANDMRTVAFIEPAALSAKAVNVAFNPQATFGNNGTTTQTAVPVRFRILNPSATEVYNQTASTPTITFNQTANVTFAPFTPLTPGVYTMFAQTELAGDSQTGNDQITSSFTVLAPLAGPYTVGTGGSFASLTADGGIFQALNAAGSSGNVSVRVISDLSLETGGNALNELAGGSSFSMRPAPGVTAIISGSASGCLIRLNGADNVTFDGSNTAGGSTRDLTITNTSTSTSSGVICASSLGAGLGSTDNAFRNLNVRGNDPTQTIVAISIGGLTAGSVGLNNNRNTVENCSVQRAIFGIYYGGGAAAAQNTGSVITRNELTGTGPNRIRRVGIFMVNDDGAVITRNRVDGIESNESADSIGIAVGSQLVDNANSTSGGVINATVSRNVVGSVVNNSAVGFSAAGITISGGAGVNTVSNNMVSGVIAQATPGDIVAGIFVVGATGSTTRLLHNSVSMSGERGTLLAQSASFALAITGADPIVEVKNNIFVTTQTSATGGVTAKSYAVGVVGTTFLNLDANFNVYNSTGANAGGFRSAALGNATPPNVDYATLGAWQAAISDDLNSQFADPLTVSLTDLHLQASSPAANAGTPVGVLVDIDGDARSITTPEIGADEIAVPNTAPTITAAIGLTRQQGSALSNSTIATVSDLESAAGTIIVTGAATINGITLSNILNNAGTVSGDLRAGCKASNAAFTLTATDGVNTTNATLNVATTANADPLLGTYSAANLIAGAGTVVNPSFGPSDNGSITSVTVGAPNFTGGLNIDSGSGAVTITNAGPVGVYTVTVVVTDNCSATTTRTFQLNVTSANAAPTISAQSGVTRQQGSAAIVGQIATVTDDGGNGAVTVTVNGGASATVNGVTVSGIANAGGTVNASVVASCTAANAAFTLTASDGSLTTNATLNVATTANTGVVLGSYGNTSVGLGLGVNVTPSAAPLDNGTISSITASAAGFGGTLSVNPVTGVVSVSNAGAASATPYTVIVTATDNCGTVTTTSFALTVTAADLSIAKTSSLNLVNFGLIQYSIVVRNAGPNTASAATVTDTFQAGLVNVNWTCVGINGGTCQANGTGNINRQVNLPSGATVVYSVIAEITAGVVGDSITNMATVSSTQGDPVSSNNSSTITNGIWLFKDGFELAAAQASSVRLGLSDTTQRVELPSAALLALAQNPEPVEVIRFDIGLELVVVQTRRVDTQSQARALQRNALGTWTSSDWTSSQTGLDFEWTNSPSGVVTGLRPRS